MARNLILIIEQMELHSSLNPEGMRPEDHFSLGLLINSANILAQETGMITVILLAKKMTNVYDSLKVKGG
jgi:hypothetical protein